MKNKTSIIQKIVIAILVVIAVNWFGSKSYTRFDLTEDKRFTLSEETVNFLEQLEDTLRFSVYLDGDLPIAFTKMQRELKDLLNEIERIGGNKILVKFIDPVGIGSKTKSNVKAFENLQNNYGLIPYTIQEEDETGKLTQRYVIPGFLISVTKGYVPINLFANVIGNNTDERIFEALSVLEYECLKGMKQLTTKKRKSIGILSGQNELSDGEMYDAMSSLVQMYNVDKITTQNLLDSINKYEAIIIAKPQSDFTERDKFILDQYLMHNGNMLGLFDMIRFNPDTLKYVSDAPALSEDRNFTDFLFNMGVRINSDLLVDNQCALIPYDPNRREVGAPWYYFPLLRGNDSCSITKGIDVVKTEYTSTIDIVEGNGTLKKTPLLTSSAYANSIQTPTNVGFRILGIEPTSFFTKSYLTGGVLVEGELESLFKTRSAPITKTELPEGFEVKAKSQTSKMVIISDGDIFKNGFKTRNGDTVGIEPMYMYKYFAVDKRVYTGNKKLLLNSVNYLCGDTALIALRSREIKIRLLNKNRILEEKSYWQMLNILVPLVLLGIAGVVIMVVRKRKYTKNVS